MISTLRAVNTGIPKTEVPPLSQRKEGINFIWFRVRCSRLRIPLFPCDKPLPELCASVVPSILPNPGICADFWLCLQKRGGSLHSCFTRSYIYDRSCRYYHTGYDPQKMGYLRVGNCTHIAASGEPAYWE